MDSSPGKNCPNLHDDSQALEYLRTKVKKRSMFQQMARLDDILNIDPWDAAAVDNRSPGKKYFLSRCNSTSDCKTTKTGFWTPIGNLKTMRYGPLDVGKRTFAFYKGRRPHAKLTEWRIDMYIVDDVLKASPIAFCCLYCHPEIQYATETSSSVEIGTGKEFKARGKPQQRYVSSHE